MDEMNQAAREAARNEKKRLYISESEKTFSYDENRPDLPVPPLGQTIKKYLDSVRAIVSEEDYKATEAIAKQFASGVGAKLHEKLLQKAKHSRNWLEKWWEDMAYLSSRQPLMPSCHMAGSFAQFADAHSFTGTRSAWAADNVGHYLEFWQLLRQEKLKPQSFRKIPWTMHQFRRLFNTARIPVEGKDEIVNKFLVESEESVAGRSPTNLIVLQQGHIFSFEVVNERGDVLTRKEIETQLERIDAACTQLGPSQRVGTLTAGDRDTWAANRRLLQSLHPDNKRNLETIEHSLFVLVLDDASPENRQEVVIESLKGDCSNRWVDKSYSLIVFKNLTIGSSADHTPFDGMVPVSCAHYAHLSHIAQDEDASENEIRGPLPEPEHLEFHLNDDLLNEIDLAKVEYLRLCDNIDILCEVFTGYGKGFMKPVRVHPEAYLQLALQLAYYRLHNKPAPTYTTASTREFYHGRTETCRSCTCEMMDFVRAMDDGHSSPATIVGLMKRAVEKFGYLMVDCCRNHGCDRHLMGLALIALEDGTPMPELFLDPSFVRSGGNGNFILSTSCNGYTPLIGCVAPMCKDGYGAFYSIEETRIIIAISAFRDSTETNASALYKEIVHSFTDMQSILLAAKL